MGLRHGSQAYLSKPSWSLLLCLERVGGMAGIGCHYEPQRQNQPIYVRYRTGPTSATTYIARLQIASQCTEILGDPYLGTDQSEGDDGSSRPELPLIDLLLTNSRAESAF